MLKSKPLGKGDHSGDRFMCISHRMCEAKRILKKTDLCYESKLIIAIRQIDRKTERQKDYPDNV